MLYFLIEEPEVRLLSDLLSKTMRIVLEMEKTSVFISHFSKGTSEFHWVSLHPRKREAVCLVRVRKFTGFNLHTLPVSTPWYC